MPLPVSPLGLPLSVSSSVLHFLFLPSLRAFVGFLVGIAFGITTSIVGGIDVGVVGGTAIGIVVGLSVGRCRCRFSRRSFAAVGVAVVGCVIDIAVGTTVDIAVSIVVVLPSVSLSVPASISSSV